jgi:hypothetical protein
MVQAIMTMALLVGFGLAGVFAVACAVIWLGRHALEFVGWLGGKL